MDAACSCIGEDKWQDAGHYAHEAISARRAPNLSCCENWLNLIPVEATRIWRH